MDVEVVSVSSRVPTEPYYHFDVYLESLRRFGMTPTVLGMDLPWGGLMTKPNVLREWLRGGRNRTDRLILCDAWDIVFSQHPHGIADRCAEMFGDAVVFNGEKGCWPRADLADAFPEDGSPWRYLNSGFMCGPADKILIILEEMGLEAIGLDRRNETDTDWIYPNDQGEFQRMFALQPVKMLVDTQCRLAQTLSACELGEFDLSGEHVVNRETGTTPGVWHFNGGAKELMMPGLRAKWGI